MSPGTAEVFRGISDHTFRRWFSRGVTTDTRSYAVRVREAEVARDVNRPSGKFASWRLVMNKLLRISLFSIAAAKT